MLQQCHGLMDPQWHLPMEINDPMHNAKPELTFWTSSLSDPPNLNLFKGCFFVIHQNNNPSPDEQKPSPCGKTHPVQGISILDWSVDAYGDSCQPTEA